MKRIIKDVTIDKYDYGHILILKVKFAQYGSTEIELNLDKLTPEMAATKFRRLADQVEANLTPERLNA